MKAFLDAIHQHHILRLGPAEYLQVQRLLEVCPDLERTELRVALASLLATNREQWQQIVGLFEQYYPEAVTFDLPESRSVSRTNGQACQPRVGADSSAPQTSAQTKPRWQFREALAQAWRRLYNAPRWLLFLLLLVCGLSVSIAVLLALLSQPPQVFPVAVPPKPPTLSTEAQEPWSLKPFLEEQVRQVDMWLPLRSLDWVDGLAVALALLLVLLGLRWLRLPSLVARVRQARAAARQHRSSLERRRLAEQAERNHAPVKLTYQVERYASLDDQAIEDAASLLGRLFHATVSDDLNVPATVRTSIDGGGRLIPIYANRPVARELTVLVDVERGDHPWLAGITWVLERWKTLGVPCARFDFRFDPLFVTAHTTGNAFALQHLARHADGGPLVVISRMLSTQGYRQDAGWLEEIAAWPVKAWLDPDPRPLGERRRERQDIRRLEQHYGLQRFPFSAAGLLALARYFAEDGQGVPAPAWPSLLPLHHTAVANALPRWALLAALVPDPTWEQLEAIRRYFPELSSVLPAPRYVQRLLDWVAREDREDHPESEDGRTLVLSPALVDRLIRQQRLLDAEQPGMQRLEARGRQLLLRQLDATRPDDALLGQFWELKRLSHRLYLEPEQALAMIAPLLGGAVEPELLQMVETELEREEGSPRFEPGVRDRLDLVVGRVADRLQSGELLGRPWRAWCEPALVTLGALLLAGLLVWYGPAGLHAWLRHPPHPGVTTVVSPAIQSIVKPMTVSNSLGIEFVQILAGEFQMGSTTGDSNERPVHTVRISQPFYLGKYEVTQGQWQAIMGKNPSQFTGDPNLPVEHVSWEDAQEFLRRLNAQEGGTKYRLPTEAEWEYAARAGSTTDYSFGNDKQQLGEYAWFRTNAGGKPHPVGQRKPNVWGLYDMHGNVWEWVQGWYGTYAAETATDPSGPTSGSFRVIRGGGWPDDAGYCRSAYRISALPGDRNPDLGFRLVRTAP